MHFFALTVLTLIAQISSGIAKSGPLTVAYVEVNSNSIDNTARYQLADGSNVFDIAIIFASNMKSNGGRATWFNNQNVQAVLDNAACEIKPLQEKGIKVVLSLLGGGSGRGISNFASSEEAAAFARLAADQIRLYDLDGIDLDDEYAQYGDNGTPQTNSQSIGWLLQALRKELPDKLITMYNYGPAGQYLMNVDSSIGSILDYAWNPNYGTFDPPLIPGLGKKNLAAASIAIAGTDIGIAQKLANKTVEEGYAVYLTYNLAEGDQSQYVGAFAKSLYGQETKYVPFNDDTCCSAA